MTPTMSSGEDFQTGSLEYPLSTAASTESFHVEFKEMPMT